MYKPCSVGSSIQVKANESIETHVKVTDSNSYFKMTQPNLLDADKLLALIWCVGIWWWPVVAGSLPSKVQKHANMAACTTIDQFTN